MFKRVKADLWPPPSAPGADRRREVLSQLSYLAARACVEVAEQRRLGQWLPNMLATRAHEDGGITRDTVSHLTYPMLSRGLPTPDSDFIRPTMQQRTQESRERAVLEIRAGARISASPWSLAVLIPQDLLWH